MKSILYVAGALMVAASIYGFVEYKKKSQSPVFNSLYKSEKQVEPVTNPTVELPTNNSAEILAPATEHKTTINSNKKIEKRSKKIRKEYFSRAPLREDEIDLPIEKNEN